MKYPINIRYTSKLKISTNHHRNQTAASQIHHQQNLTTLNESIGFATLISTNSNMTLATLISTIICNRITKQ
jgi:hypothetical protein